MRMPLILSTLLAALAIPVAMASQGGADAPAPAGDAAAHAADAGTMADQHAQPMKKKRHKHRRHHRGAGGPGHTPSKWDQPYDYIMQEETSSCGGGDTDHGKMMPPEVPGQKGPHVPRGQ